MPPLISKIYLTPLIPQIESDDPEFPGMLLIVCRPIVSSIHILCRMKVSDLERFGSTVRHMREKAGISQEELADLAGLHRTYIGGVERGERNIGLLNVIRIARALNVRPGDLLRDIPIGGSR